MRILQVFKDYFPPTRGGIEQHINEIVHSLRGFKFSVLTSSRSSDQIVDDDEGVRVVRAKEAMRISSTPVTPAWPKLLREAGADLFHFHMPNPFGEVSFLRSRASVPMVASYHADIVGRDLVVPAFRPFQRAFLSKARAIIVSNPRMLETSEALERHRDRCHVIPYGVEPSDWVERPPYADEIREGHPGPIVLFLGRLVYYKGVDVLIQAMRSVEATLLIVGDGPLRAKFEAMTNELRLRHKVVFVGEIEDDQRAAYYHAADLFAFPSTSRAEAFGISMLEAMAAGTPVISTELGTGTSWVNQNRVTGAVISVGDVAELSGTLKTLLGDSELRSELGVAAQVRVREHFTRFQMLESLATLYASV